MNNNFIFEIYVIALVVFAVWMLISILVANSIAYQPGTNPKDPAKRKMWFWIIGALTLVTVFVADYFIVYNGLTVPKQQDAAMLHQCIASVAAFIVYIIFGFSLSKVFKRSKLGTWF